MRLLKVIQGYAFRSPSHSPRLELGCLLGAAAGKLTEERTDFALKGGILH